MKIESHLNTWRSFGEKITTLLAHPHKRATSGKKLLKLNNHFLSWPLMPKRLLSVQSGFSLAPKVDLKILESFVRSHKNQRGLGAILINSPFGDWQGQSVHQAIAVKKMASLVQETVLEMKKVELIHLSTVRG